MEYFGVCSEIVEMESALRTIHAVVPTEIAVIKKSTQKECMAGITALGIRAASAAGGDSPEGRKGQALAVRFPFLKARYPRKGKILKSHKRRGGNQHTDRDTRFQIPQEPGQIIVHMNCMGHSHHLL
jgi:hypothetical protein